MTATSVKFFAHTMPGAPALSGSAGAVVSVLDACLVNGFGAKALDSLVVASGIATATISTGHSHVANGVALVAGATPADLNGERRVLSVSATQFTFDASGINDQTATGTITTKVAPLGWVKPYSGTNKAAYKATDLTATACMLRVDDTSAQAARVVGYESMTDVDTGTGPFPTAAQQSGGFYWSKSDAASSAARPWFLFGDERTIYLCIAPANTIARHSVFGFGDIMSYAAVDAYGAFLAGAASINASLSAVHNTDLARAYVTSSPGVNDGMALARDYTGVGASVGGCKAGALYVSASAAFSGSNSYHGSNLAYPNPADQSLITTPVHIFSANGVARGVLPGVLHTPQIINAGSVFASGDIVSGTGASTGKKIMAIRGGSSSIEAAVFFDILGPWR